MAEWEDNRFAYVGDSYQCPGCEILEQEDDNIPEGARGVHKLLRKNNPDELIDDDGWN